MRRQALLTASVALAGTVALAGCGSGPAPSSAAYTTAPPAGSTAVRPDPKAPIVLSSGTDIRAVEGRLAQLNFTPGRVNVSWDSDSQAAVEDFQRVQGAPVGPLDRATLEAMGLMTVPLTQTGPVASTSGLAGLPAEAESAPGQTRVGAVTDSGRAPVARRPAAAPGAAAGAAALSPRALGRAEVSEVQQKLRDRGLYRGEIDGIWGPLSDRALLDFQAANSLRAEGQIDAATATALGLDLQRLGAGSEPGGLRRIGPSGTTTGTVRPAAPASQEGTPPARQ